MSDLIQLDKNLITIKRLQEQVRLLEEQLEYFTDKYGLPSDWTPLEKMESTPATATEEIDDSNILTLPKKAKKKPNDSELEGHKHLVADSVIQLLKVQMNDLMELMAAQHNSTAAAYKTISTLKERLPTGKLNPNK